MASSMANSMTNTITGDIHKATTWSIVLSLLMIAAGVLAIFSPAIITRLMLSVVVRRIVA